MTKIDKTGDKIRNCWECTDYDSCDCSRNENPGISTLCHLPEAKENNNHENQFYPEERRHSHGGIDEG